MTGSPESEVGSITRLLFCVLLLVAAVSLSVTCSPRESAVRGAAELAPSVAVLGQPVWTDPIDLGAIELLGFGLPPRRESAPLRALRVSKDTGCGKALPQGVQSGKTVLRTLNSGGLKRTYRLHLPSRASTVRPMPVLLNFHGRTSSGADQELYSGLVPISDRETFVLVSPDGTGTPSGWSAGATSGNGVDDVRFVNDLLDTLERELCVDSARVYAAGFSNGAFMTSKLACAIPERITAIAGVGGIDYAAEGCPARVPVLAVHGTNDGVVPMSGGTVRAWRYPGVKAAMVEWSATNGCLPSFTTTELRPGVTLQHYDNCGATTQVVVLAQAGHVWPGSPGTNAADPAGSISGAELIWAFFATAKRTQ